MQNLDILSTNDIEIHNEAILLGIDLVSFGKSFVYMYKNSDSNCVLMLLSSSDVNWAGIVRGKKNKKKHPMLSIELSLKGADECEHACT